MPQALEVIAGQATAPGAVFTALTMNTGNSNTVRFAALGTVVRLMQMWAKNQAAGVFRIRSPKLHDAVNGIRIRNPASLVISQLPFQAWQNLVPQDTLTMEITGSAVGGQFEEAAALIYYADLPGQAARLTTYADVVKRGVNIMGSEVSITPGAAGGYSGQVAVNSQFDQWKANTDYALMGYRVDTRCAVARIQGVDTGNLGVGGPGEPSIADVTANWFMWLSLFQNLPLVPVFNSANKFSILVDVMQDQGAAVVVTTWEFMELAPGPLATA